MRLPSLSDPEVGLGLGLGLGAGAGVGLELWKFEKPAATSADPENKITAQ